MLLGLQNYNLQKAPETTAKHPLNPDNQSKYQIENSTDIRTDTLSIAAILKAGKPERTAALWTAELWVKELCVKELWTAELCVKELCAKELHTTTEQKHQPVPNDGTNEELMILG